MNASLDEKLKNVRWGEYSLNKLFVGSNGDFDIQKEHINGKGEYVITAGSTNNGILGRTDINARIFDKGTITVDMFGFAFYRQFKYKIVTHARVFSLEPIRTVTDNQGLFLASALHFIHKTFGYDNMCSWEKIQNTKIKLPVKSNENGKIDDIDFDFMESVIAELKAERTEALSAYLKSSGLDNCELSEEEEKAIELMNSDNIEWTEYKLEDLFCVKKYKRKFDANKITVLENGEYPYVVRMSGNNGQKGFLDEDEKFLNEGNTLSFGQDTATVFYQEKPYFTGDKIKILKCKNERFGKRNALFFVAAITKAFSLFSWGSTSYSKEAIGSQMIKLPAKNGKPDIDFMELLISAIQKLVIKDVVRYTDRCPDAEKKIAVQ